MLEGSPAAACAIVPPGRSKTIEVEHPTGSTACAIELDAHGKVASAGMLRTARKLFDGTLFGRSER
jgi:4-oxalomesaconate tautomerase